MSKKHTKADALAYRKSLVDELENLKLGQPFNEALTAPFYEAQAEAVAQQEKWIAEFDAMGIEAWILQQDRQHAEFEKLSLFWEEEVFG